MGSKISLISDVKGVPLGFTFVGANKADHTLMQQTIDKLKFVKKHKQSYMLIKVIRTDNQNNVQKKITLN